MSIFYSINPSRRLIHAVAGETITPDCLRGFRAELLQDCTLDPEYSLLIDLRNVEHVGIASDEIESLTRSSVLADHSKRALVADSTLLYGLSRMYQTLSGRFQSFKVFDTLEAANDWLGAP